MKRYLVLDGCDAVHECDTLGEAEWAALALVDAIKGGMGSGGPSSAQDACVSVCDTLRGWSLAEVENADGSTSLEFCETAGAGSTLDGLLASVEALEDLLARFRNDCEAYRLGVEDGLKRALEAVRAGMYARWNGGKTARREGKLHALIYEALEVEKNG